MKKILSSLGLLLAFCWTFHVSAQTLLFDWGVKNGVAGKIAGSQVYTVNLNGNTLSGDALQITSGAKAVEFIPPAEIPAGNGVSIVLYVTNINASLGGALAVLRSSTTSPSGATAGFKMNTNGTMQGTWQEGAWGSGLINATVSNGDQVMGFTYKRNNEGTPAGIGSCYYLNGSKIVNFSALQSTATTQRIAIGGVSGESSTLLNVGMKIMRIQIYSNQLSVDEMSAASTVIKESFTLPTTYMTSLGAGSNLFSELSFSPSLPSDLSKATLDVTAVANSSLNIDQAITPFTINLKGVGPLKLQGESNISQSTPVVAQIPVILERSAVDISGVSNLVTPSKVVAQPYGANKLFSGASLFNKGVSIVWPDLPAHVAVRYDNVANSAIVSFASRSIDVNFGGSVSGSATSGAYPVMRSQWNNCANATGTDIALKVSKSDGTVDNSTAKITYTSNNTYSYTTGVTDPILSNYLDDGGGISITIKDIPFAKYRVIVYRATDSDAGFSSTMISGVSYTSTALGTTAPAFTIKGGGAFGKSRLPAPVKGINYLVSDPLTDANVSVSTVRAGSNRGCVAAVQIVEVDDNDQFDVDELNTASIAIRTTAQSKIDAVNAITSDKITSTPTSGFYLDTKLEALKTSLTPYLSFTASTFDEVASTLVAVNAMSPQVVKTAFNGIYLVKRPATGIEPQRGTYLSETGANASSKAMMNGSSFWRVTTTDEDDAVIKMVNVKSGNQVNPLATSNAAFTLTSEDRLITLVPLDGTDWKDVTQYKLTHNGIRFHRASPKLSGTSDNQIVNWDGALNSASSWALMPLEEAVAQAIADAKAVKYKVGDKVGCVSAENTALLDEAIEALESASSDDEKIDGVDRLALAINTYQSHVIAPVVNSGKFYFMKGLRGPGGEAYARAQEVGSNATISPYISTEKNKYLFELVTTHGITALKTREMVGSDSVFMSTPSNDVLQATLVTPTTSISTIRVSPYNRTTDNRAMWILEGDGYRLHTGGATSPTPHGLYNWTGNAADNSSWDLIEYSPEVALFEVIIRALAKLNSYTEGTHIGQIPVGSKATFEARIAAARAIYDNYSSKSASEIEAEELSLDSDIAAFNPTPIAPKMEQWYVVKSSSDQSLLTNRPIQLEESGALTLSASVDVDELNSRIMWKFVEDGAGQIHMVNRASKGNFVENKTHASGHFHVTSITPVAGITFHYLDSEQLFIISQGQLHAEITGNVVCWTTNFTTSTSSTWMINEVLPADLTTLATAITDAEAAIVAATGRPGVDAAIAATQSAIEAAQLLTASAYQEEVTAAILALEEGVAAIDEGLAVGVDSTRSIEKVYVESGSVKATHANTIQVFTLTGVEVQNANLKSGVYIAKVAGKSFKVTMK